MIDRGQQFQRLTEHFRGEILTDEPMRKHTSFKIGGPADFMVYPRDLDDLQAVLNFVHKEGLPRYIIGNGSNLLVADEGLRGVVISLSRAFNHLQFKDNRVIAGAGGPLGRLVAYCRERGLSGLEWACGIPARLGGAVMLNAGAYGGQLSDVLLGCQVMDGDGNIEKLDLEALNMGYRSIGLPAGSIVLECELSLKDGNPKEMERIEQAFMKTRRDKQPLSLPNAGSTFRNPPGDAAGRIIEEAGCKGLRIGDAMVSKKHANFFINCGVASATDVRRLMAEVQNRVEKRFGIKLTPEIHFLGFTK